MGEGGVEGERLDVVWVVVEEGPAAMMMGLVPRVGMVGGDVLCLGGKLGQWGCNRIGWVIGGCLGSDALQGGQEGVEW